ncbi:MULTISPECIES: citrate-proton symporter [unclassified Pseudomonas]|uniref:citrate-proton symporter n=1 Tax=unclassified Pseudomonas TaxID=196821 RepID=UPI00087684FD|nr:MULTISPECIES: citrate-proton symporter [unclassified Pseudomonas]SCZ75767.1 Predicted arabinose efflux permease, MFS family [Pseudomonas sp. NFPP17]SDA38257.1 Predicted arabinose efflux permease, MFS family [Pseudomonas sp. NFPP15]SEK52232.1 Predicted arabinose efflux permease, MFS family [Pseudomonas sp. NFPP18]SFA68374.1 Predicted arabinose efflux permease, MFS family [Pseudomonas sp. NFPP13]SFT36442.1 Predicted arabinose efflux permease, MFS family [Pseudomonas sp. NFPP25]
MHSQASNPSATPEPETHNAAGGKRSVFAVILGNAVEFFDFGVYATFAVMIGHTFFPSDSAFVSLMLSVTAFGVGFIVRPLGAVLIGAYADRVGRKPAMLLTLVMMAVGTGSIAILPSYESIGIAAPILLVLTRLIQGLAWGGEAGPATTYILEAAPAHKRGTYACWQVVAQGVAAMAAGTVGYTLTQVLSPEDLNSWGWRVPFVFGLLVLPIGIYIRRNLAETFHGQGETASTGSLVRQVFGEHRRALVLGLLILSGSTITQYFINYMTTFALTELKLPTSISMLSTLVAGAAMAVCAIAGGMLCDRFGRRTILMAPRVVLLLVLFPALQLMTEHPSPTTFLLTLAVLSGLHGMSGAALIVLLVESFPKAVRSTGFSIVYAFGVAAFGGTAQIIITWLIGTTGNPMSPVGYLLVANLVCLTAAWFAKETRPQAPGRSNPGQRLAEARAR